MTSLLGRVRRGEPLRDLEIIDMHGHLGRWFFAIPTTSAASLVAAMDRVGVRTIVCSHMGCMSGRATEGNAVVLEAMRAHPGRIEGYVSVWPGSAAEVLAEAGRRLEEGFTGLKLHDSNGFPYTDDAYAPALAMAHERALPVLLHTWGAEEQFRQARELAGKYPDVAFLLAHSGSRRPEEYVRIACECENVYLDLSYSAAPRGLIAELVAGAGAEKVVWGSDAVFLCMPQQLGRVLGADISEADKLKLLSTNAKRILGRIRR